LSEIDQLDRNPYRFSGEYYDSESGYVYLRARYYDTSLGRFISEDAAFDGKNWYVYAGNNPIMFVDPTGLYIQLSQNNTVEQNQVILNDLQKLTNHKLSVGKSGKIKLTITLSVHLILSRLWETPKPNRN
ncbi:MAG: RHS repeat-associated core domain-containing protein, partial [Oscillospiraceae bacterium]|nr:RHS repeat-associated core domain-containing protein [Oscillospiraceae bacterium]